MKRFVSLLFLLYLSAASFGCSCYSNAIPLDEATNTAIKGKIVSVGVVDCRTTNVKPAISKDASDWLSKEANLPDHSSNISPEEQALLLSDPITLTISKQRLGDLQKRLGARYVLVGKEGAHPILDMTIWDMAIGIPLGPVIIAFMVPVPMSSTFGVTNAERMIRIVDLEETRVVAEYYSILRDGATDVALKSSEISNGIYQMNLTKEK